MRIALIGRPNVGKSTLFNRLVKQKNAIVGDMPGITRDRKVGRANLFGNEFDVVDTPGVDTFSKDALACGMNEQSFAAVKEADLILFVVDSTEGLTEYDKSIALWLRKSFKMCGSKPTILLKNKSERKDLIDDFQSLGFGNGISISAEHNLGFSDLYSELLKYDLRNPDEQYNEEIYPLKIAIVGRPNVGKSTLVNAIIGEERLLTGPQAGVTRDAIPLNWKFNNQHVLLIDTAGQRRKSKVNEKIETVSVTDAWRHINQANIVVVVMDINNPIEKQDLTIARKAFDEGKVVLFALNKSDSVDNPKEIQEYVQRRLQKEFAQVPNVSCLLVSAKEKKGLARIFNVSLDLYGNWSKRISTGLLNKWFQDAIAQNPPPLVNGLPIKLKYISQTNSKPPTFAVFANRAEHLPASYERYLLNHIRKSFDLYGIPLRIYIRQRKNPYDS